MIVYNIKNELNKTFLSATAEIVRYDDYRFKMITDNKIDGIIDPELRSINGESKLYYDISGKENFVKYISVRNLDISELLNLTECMMRVSENLREFLLEESCIVFEPDMIFRNPRTGKYEFICLPGHLRNDTDVRDDLMSLLQLILSHVDPENTIAVEAAYGIYEIAAAGSVCVKSLYEAVWEMTEESESDHAEFVEEEEDMPESFYESVEKGPIRLHYHPSFKEWLAVGFAASGLVCIGLSTYWSMLYK